MFTIFFLFASCQVYLFTLDTVCLVSPPSLYLSSTPLQPLLYTPRKFVTVIVSLMDLHVIDLAVGDLSFLAKSLYIKPEYIFTNMFYTFGRV